MLQPSRDVQVGLLQPVSSSHRLARIDGIRALAVLLVLGTHTALAYRGWEGVHIFFVLSGFLITGILRRARNDEVFWKPFYIKRATRILPPLLLLFAGGYLLYRPPLLPMLGYGLFAANFLEPTRFRLPHAFTVLWSLSVEEHFYLVWPFAVRFWSRRQLMGTCVALLLCEPVLRAAVLLAGGARFIYMYTPLQLDGLAAGSLLALLCEEPEARTSLRTWSPPVLAASAVLYVSLSLLWRPYLLSSDSLVFNATGYSLIVLIASALLMTVYLHPEIWLSRLLASRPAAFLGGISYGVYLYHLCLLDATMRLILSVAGRPRFYLALLAALPMVLLVSWVSFHFYEKPIISWGKRKALQESGRRSPLPANV